MKPSANRHVCQRNDDRSSSRYPYEGLPLNSWAPLSSGRLDCSKSHKSLTTCDTTNSLQTMHKSLFSPDTESFSTPPTTPSYDSPANLPSSLGRKVGKPSSLVIGEGQIGWKPDILIEENSPNTLRKSNGTTISPTAGREQSSTPKGLSATSHLDTARLIHHHKPMDSPCFVHSFLDKTGSLTDWVRSKQNGLMAGLDKHAYRPGVYSQTNVSSPASTTSSSMENNDEDEFGGNLTKHLAETAVGVREMSKQLGWYLYPLEWVVISHIAQVVLVFALTCSEC